MIDLRSDTVTRPSDKMRAAMAAAEVGDDVFGDDPTVNRLQAKAAEVFEKAAALFVPTGCMGNEIAVKVHTLPGQEIVTEDRGHILNYELGAAAVISGVTIRAVKSADGSGHLKWSEIEPALHIDPPYYQAATGLICLENTHNFAGGSVMTGSDCAQICANAHAVGLPVHMDGARIFNAAAALGESVADLTRHCDSVMFTLIKRPRSTGWFDLVRLRGIYCERPHLAKTPRRGNASDRDPGRCRFDRSRRRAESLARRSRERESACSWPL